ISVSFAESPRPPFLESHFQRNPWLSLAQQFAAQDPTATGSRGQRVMSGFYFPRDHWKNLMDIQHASPGLKQVGQALFKQPLRNGSADRGKRSFVIVDIDRDETALWKIVGGIRTAMVKRQ